MFFEDELQELRRNGWTPAALAIYVRRAGARIRRHLDANPGAVRSMWLTAIGFFAGTFVMAAIMSSAYDRDLAVEFFAQTSWWILLTFACLTLNIDLLRDRDGVMLSGLNVPIVLTLARVVLVPGIALFLTRGHYYLASATYLFAVLTDVADGWLARRLNMTSATGAALDAIADKLFAITVAVALVVRGRFSIGQILLLNARELGELPLLVWMLGSQRARRRRSENATSNLAGKATTVLQFAAIASALFEAPHTGIWAGATALVGACAAAAYWSRECRAIARDRPPRDESAHAA